MRFKLFRFGRKKRKEEEAPEEEYGSLREERDAESEEVEKIIKNHSYFERENVDLKNGPARIAYLERLRDTIMEGKHQCEEVKFEYGRVTSYLKDIQLID